MAPLSEPKRPCPMCKEGEYFECACSEEETDETEEINPIGEKPEDEYDWCWRMPDVNLLEKLQLICESQDELRYDPDSDFEEETEVQIDSSEREIKVTDQGLWSNLLEELLEKVIARLPLPGSFIRASTLSKQWQLRFESASFQHEVNSCSIASWSSFCPLFVTDNVKALLGFERRSRRWCRLPTLSYLPHEVVDWELIAACGSILCLTKQPGNAPIFVTNPLTRKWRKLPPCLAAFGFHLRRNVHIVCEGGSENYKVVICSRPNFFSDVHGILIFDSTDHSWTTTQFSVTAPRNDCKCCCSAVVKGVLHKLFAIDYPGMDGKYCYGRNSFDLKEKVWTGASCLYQIFPENPRKPPRPVLLGCGLGLCELLVCGSKLILVTSKYHYISDTDGDRDQETLSVFELDLEEGWAVEVSTAPIHLLETVGSFVHYAVCHGNSIYIGNGRVPLIRYDLAIRDWFWWDSDEDFDESEIMMSKQYIGWWRWAPITYQPGLNPWLEI